MRCFEIRLWPTDVNKLEISPPATLLLSIKLYTPYYFVQITKMICFLSRFDRNNKVQTVVALRPQCIFLVSFQDGGFRTDFLFTNQSFYLGILTKKNTKHLIFTSSCFLNRQYLTFYQNITSFESFVFLHILNMCLYLHIAGYLRIKQLKFCLQYVILSSFFTVM